MVVPAGNPYMRSEKPEASGFDRIEMCTLALDDLSDALQEKVVLTDLEVRRDQRRAAVHRQGNGLAAGAADERHHRGDRDRKSVV